MNDPAEKTKTLFLCVLGIIALTGLIMVYSSSYIYAREHFGDSLFFVRKQFFFFVGALMMGTGLGFVPFRFIVRMSSVVHIAAVSMLVLTLFSSTGVELKGASRWLILGGWQFQPGEFVKYSLLLYGLLFFERFSHLSWKSRGVRLLLLVLPLIFFVQQPDFGSFAMSLLMLAFACYVSRFPRLPFYSGLLIAAATAGGVLFSAPYRVQRLLTFLDPWKDPRESGFQIIQSFLAFANGSWTGLGLGNSNEKLFYLPESYNDFILSVIGEETGFIGVAFVVALYLFLTFFGLKMALYAKVRVARLFLTVATFALSIQAWMNMAVVLGLLPTKGLNLPFISYGGSSYFANACLVGLMFSALRAGPIKKERPRVQPYSSTWQGQSWQTPN